MIEYIKEIEKLFESYFPECENSAVSAMRYSFLSGGKRIRPTVLTEFCILCGGKAEDALNFATAIEMIHTYSLIHDDLPCMDNDDMRRGRPSCHKAFGESTALLAGDGLLTNAFKVASDAKNVRSDYVLAALGVLSEKAGTFGMVEGQVLDLKFENTSPDLKELDKMYLKKTGCLLEAAAQIGCILAGADEELIKSAEKYGKNLGLAFQIIDDILDITADEKTFGKPVGSDVKNGKVTYVSLYGIEKSRQKAKELTLDALNELEHFHGDISNLKKLTEELLVRNY